MSNVVYELLYFTKIHFYFDDITFFCTTRLERRKRTQMVARVGLTKRTSEATEFKQEYGIKKIVEGRDQFIVEVFVSVSNI